MLLSEISIVVQVNLIDCLTINCLQAYRSKRSKDTFNILMYDRTRNVANACTSEPRIFHSRLMDMNTLYAGLHIFTTIGYLSCSITAMYVRNNQEERVDSNQVVQ